MSNQKSLKKKSPSASKGKFTEGVDYYFENGLMVLTARFLEKRGYCCGNGCRHCPYPNDEKPDYNKKVSNSSFGA
jgi:hypothetical protein